MLVISVRPSAEASAPWWGGLILAALGLSFLALHGRRRVSVREIVEKDGAVIIEGTIKSSDPADTDRLLELMRQRLRDLTGEEPPR